MKKRNTKAKGDHAHAAVMTALIAIGKTVLLPFGDNARYDLAIDEGRGKFVRVQCKMGRLRNGAIIFNTCSNHYHRKGKTKHYRGAADKFGVFCQNNGRVYLVPVRSCGNRSAYLRLLPARSGRKNKLKLAKKYELPS